MVQLAAMIASGVGRLGRLPRPRLQLMVACGAAAGIASAYNAPIGGALFVAEIVLGTIAMESFGPLLFASFMASVLARALGSGMALYAVQAFRLESFAELFGYLGLGLVAGVLAPAFLWLLETSTKLFASLPMPLWGRMALGGLVVGAISINHPYVWGNGQGALQVILDTDWVWNVLLMLLLMKLAATASTVGSGAVGGVFTPTLLVGAVIGGLVGNAVHAFAPLHTGAPHFYALVGAGAFLAATTHAPLMAILIMFDMTLAHEIVLPLMLACVSAHVVAQALRPTSIYAVPRKALREEPPAQEPLARLTVARLVRPDPPKVSGTARLAEILDAFVQRRHNNLYVVDSVGRFEGVIPLHEMKSMLNDPDLHRLTIAHDYLREDFPRVGPDTPLDVALQMFTTHPIERLPVVDERGKLVGSISKTDLLLALAGTNARAKT
jgi:CIC family chloride channel protein